MPFDEEELDPHGECAAEIKRLQNELEYAYRVIEHGYVFGTFDFSVLRTRASNYLADKETGVGPMRDLLVQTLKRGM